MDLKYKVTVHYQRNIIKMKYFKFGAGDDGLDGVYILLFCYNLASDFNFLFFSALLQISFHKYNGIN